jgi:RNA polymerase sigma-70 factor, ECF subfamily
VAFAPILAQYPPKHARNAYKPATRNFFVCQPFTPLRCCGLENRLAALKEDINERVNERALVEAAQKDPRRFADLYEANFERVYAFIARRVRDRDVAQDLTADVFHSALAKLGQFEWRGVPFAAWLYRIASNAMADRWERNAREHGNPMPEDFTKPETDAIEQRAMLSRLVESLPADQRRVVHGRFLEQKSIREIAQELRRSEGAVKQLQFRALQNLRLRMEESHG